MIQQYEKRKEKIQQRENLDNTIPTSVFTVNNSNLTYKIQRLRDDLVTKYFPEHNFFTILRFDVSSYYKRNTKFKSYVAIEKNGRQHKFSFACTCSTGSRSTPCVHSVLAVLLNSL